MNWTQFTVLAGEQPAGNPPAGTESIWPLLLPFAVVFLLYQFLIARPQRRDQAKRDEMLKQLEASKTTIEQLGQLIGGKGWPETQAA